MENTFIVQTEEDPNGTEVGATEMLQRVFHEKGGEKQFNKIYEHFKKNGYVDEHDKFLGKKGVVPASLPKNPVDANKPTVPISQQENKSKKKIDLAPIFIQNGK